MKYLPVLCLFLISKCTFAQADQRYPAEIEQHIQRIIHSLQMETVVRDSFATHTLEKQMAYYHTPGVSIAVINNGEIEWARGFGYADVSSKTKVDTSTIFQAASISKPTTSLAVMKLYQDKKLDLDTNVNVYLKSWKIPAVGDWQPVITLRQLLSHTAGMTVHGFPGYQSSEKLPTTVQILNGDQPANTGPVVVNIFPGTRMRYSGGGTTIVQLALSDYFNTSFPALMQETLLTPLQMRHSTFMQPLPEKLKRYAATAYPTKGVAVKGRYHIYPEMAPAGLWTTPADLATLLIEVQEAVNSKSKYISQSTALEMLKPQQVAPFIGIGFFLQGDSVNARFEHSGWNEGFVSKSLAYKNKGYGAVVMLNSNEGEPMLNEIFRAIAEEYKWPGYGREPVQYISVNSAEADSLAGNYIADNGLKILITYSDDQLFVQEGGQPSLPMKKTKDGSFMHPSFKMSIRFQSKKLILDADGQSTEFKKVSE